MGWIHNEIAVKEAPHEKHTFGHFYRNFNGMSPFSKALVNLFDNTTYRYPMSTISLVDGAATGYGLLLALCHDYSAWSEPRSLFPGMHAGSATTVFSTHMKDLFEK